MPHVITRACCNDAACVSVCPVNCIHPTPDEPAFLTAESLYIDPETCIDCGACVDECPVDAIVSDDELDPADHEYLQINADHFRGRTVGPAAPALRPATETLDRPMHVAVVGAGPAALYAAGELLTSPSTTVDVFERLPTPHGLVRAGVAPDHAQTKGVERTFSRFAAKKTFEYFLNVEVGADITDAELGERYHAVVYAVGARSDKSLGVVGENLPGTHSAASLVAWYNGHPDHSDLDVDLSGHRAVVIGNGNVALDVARILLTDPETLACTDIADHALTALRDSTISEVVLLARRGVAHAAFTNSEFLALGNVDGLDIVIDPDDLALDSVTEAALAAGSLDPTVATKIRLARAASQRPHTPGNKRLVFRFLVSPTEILGSTAVEAIGIVGNRYDDSSSEGAEITTCTEVQTIPADMVIRAIGYRNTPIEGLPFDPVRGMVPNAHGRVLRGSDGPVVTGRYVAGWIKRGATGGIGHNRRCGSQTAAAVIEDFRRGALPDPPGDRTDLPELLAERGTRRIDNDGWKAIDAAERKAGRSTRRPRVKIVATDELITTASR